MEEETEPVIYSQSKHRYTRDNGDDVLCEITVQDHDNPKFTCCTTIDCVYDLTKRSETLYVKSGALRATLVEMTAGGDKRGQLGWQQDLPRYIKLLYDTDGQPKTSLSQAAQVALSNDELLFIEHFSLNLEYHGTGLAQDNMRAFQQAVSKIPDSERSHWAYRGPVLLSPAPITEATEEIERDSKRTKGPKVFVPKLIKSYGKTGHEVIYEGHRKLADYITIRLEQIGAQPGEDVESGGDTPTTKMPSDMPRTPAAQTDEQEPEEQDDENYEESIAQSMRSSSLAPSTVRYSDISPVFHGRKVDPTKNTLVDLSDSDVDNGDLMDTSDAGETEQEGEEDLGDADTPRATTEPGRQSIPAVDLDDETVQGYDEAQQARPSRRRQLNNNSGVPSNTVHKKKRRLSSPAPSEDDPDHGETASGPQRSNVSKKHTRLASTRS
ncbi:hypothetical protein CLAFUW4_10718 [Fulvia fulva]|nr:hypothetical protein CLAFUR4_10723 [Fulvia fulva]WPV19152.1 hypothetical protein CLAFUW4_10718 [Fulvia fulva]WPV33820.1 hypothetical protein CLAFUW7_10720 [Fulvia fulva]